MRKARDATAGGRASRSWLAERAAITHTTTPGHAPAGARAASISAATATLKRDGSRSQTTTAQPGGAVTAAAILAATSRLVATASGAWPSARAASRNPSPAVPPETRVTSGRRARLASRLDA